MPSNLSLDLDGSLQVIELPVANRGSTQDLTLGPPALGGPHEAAFSVLESPPTLAPSAEGLIELSFDPTGLSGEIGATLTLASNDPFVPTASVALHGFLHDPQLVVASTLDFGSLAPSSGPRARTLVLANGGGGQDLTIFSTEITGSNAANFTLVEPPSSVAPLANQPLEIQFDSLGGEGHFRARLEISTNDARDPLRVVNLTALAGDALPNTGLRINEFMASNGMTLDDGDGESSDWIEIYNAGPGTADLSGWHLTDSANNLDKWEFPAGTTMAEGAYLLVFASGQLTDDYVDGDGFLHTNFKLSADGEYLALVRPNGETIVSEFRPEFPLQFNDISYGVYAVENPRRDLLAGSTVDVLIPEAGSPGVNWKFASFVPDANWLTETTGSAVGYDTEPVYDPFIDVDLEDAMRGIATTAYLRLPFAVDDVEAISDLALVIHYDDGFYAYLNGDEVANRNGPLNPAWDSVAETEVDELQNMETIDLTDFLPSLRNGDNVLAIHGLNDAANSDDFLVDAELRATVAGDTLLQVGYLTQPTPGEPNSVGASNPGPEISFVTHQPQQPEASEDLVITALVLPRQEPVDVVNMQYRTGYERLSRTRMVDDGTGRDAQAGDGIYTATIPASSYGEEEMVRWFITAQDPSSATTRAPAFLDQTGKNQSPEYFGTVTKATTRQTDLPFFQWFTTSVTASHTRSGTRASAYFRGRFYDNIFVRQRGGATNGTVSQKFDFNRGDNLYVDEALSSLGEFNMNGPGSDNTYVRQTLAFDGYREAGNASCLSGLWEMRVNGSNDRIGVFIEQVDEEFLERNGYDPDGDLYKFVQRSNLNPVFFDTVTGIEKKTGNEADFSTVEELVRGLNLRNPESRRNWAIDNLDLPQIYNYLAVRSVTQDADDVRKNFYMFMDSRGDGRWRIFPWDKDWTFGVTGDGGTHLPHPFFGDEEHAKQNANQWNVLYDVLFEERPIQLGYLRRLRTVMDEVLKHPSAPRSDQYFEVRAREIVRPATPPLSGDIRSIVSFLESRRNVLYNNYPQLIPGPEPSDPDIVIESAEANPASANQDEEYICLRNAEDTEIDLSGWTIDGGVRFTFAPGTVIVRGGALYVSPDTLAFRNRATSPTGEEGNFVVGPYSGHLSNFSETLTLQDENGVVVDTFVTPDAPSDPQRYLVISEIMYHPADPHADAEFIELLNVSDSVTLDLEDVHFSEGVQFTFAPGASLIPGERVLVVLDEAAFEAVHGSGFNIAGTFQGGTRLNNGSDRLVLDDATNSTIAEFTYNDDPPWPAEADGLGFSLVQRNPESRPDPDLAVNWRGSSAPGGHPGISDALPPLSNPAANLDGDELNALLERAFGTSDLVQNSAPVTITTSGTVLTVTVQVAQAADDVRVSLEESTDLATWTDAQASFPFVNRTNHGDGTATLVLQTAPGFATTNPQSFLRVKAELAP